MITDLLQRLKTSYDPSSDTLLGTDLGIGLEEFQEDLLAVEEEKRILLF